MATIKRFEDIEAWKKGRELIRVVYKASSAAPFSRDFALRYQGRRAAVSIASNIAEGFERDGRKEFLQFLSLAKGSCGELRSQLYNAADQSYISKVQFDSLMSQTLEVSRMISGLMSYLRRTSVTGMKFKEWAT